MRDRCCHACGGGACFFFFPVDLDVPVAGDAEGGPPSVFTPAKLFRPTLRAMMSSSEQHEGARAGRADVDEALGDGGHLHHGEALLDSSRCDSNDTARLRDLF